MTDPKPLTLTLTPEDIAACRELMRQKEALIEVITRDKKFWDDDKAENARLREALEWYADPETWKFRGTQIEPYHRYEDDRGERARKALLKPDQ
jgi:hypothetical protein